VLLSDGNLRIATLAEYLHALGKKVRLVPISLDGSTDESFDSGYFSYAFARPATRPSALEALTSLHLATSHREHDEDFSGIVFTGKTWRVFKDVTNSEAVGAA